MGYSSSQTALARLQRLQNHLLPEKKEQKLTLGRKNLYTIDEVAKHNTENDCWVIINEEVIDATSFLNDHPGGKNAIMMYAGKDASRHFNIVHMKDVIARYAPETIIGVLVQRQ